MSISSDKRINNLQGLPCSQSNDTIQKEAKMKPKGRPRKARIIGQNPGIVQFSPRGRPGRPDEITIQIDQFEAIRLADCEGLDQQRAAQIMGISRPTFGRILREARKQIAMGIVKGKIIRIEKIQKEK